MGEGRQCAAIVLKLNLVAKNTPLIAKKSLHVTPCHRLHSVCLILIHKTKICAAEMFSSSFILQPFKGPDPQLGNS